MISYNVQYILNGKRQMKSIDATSAGDAFAKCLKRHPDCTLVSAHLHSNIAGSDFYLDYMPPSTAKVEPLPAEDSKQEEMNL